MDVDDGLKHNGLDKRYFIRVGFKGQFRVIHNQRKREIVFTDLHDTALFIQL